MTALHEHEVILTPGGSGGTQSCHRKRARLFGVAYEPINKSTLFERDKWTCYMCGVVCNQLASYLDDDKATIDHVIPMSKGGGHVWDNVKCACWKCNKRKLAKIPDDSQSDSTAPAVMAEFSR